MDTFKDRKEAEKYWKEEIEAGHDCTSRCGNDFDCPVYPLEEWLKEVTILDGEHDQEIREPTEEEKEFNRKAMLGINPLRITEHE